MGLLSEGFESLASDLEEDSTPLIKYSVFHVLVCTMFCAFVYLINYESICGKQINLNTRSHKSENCLKSLPHQSLNTKKNTNLCSEFQIFFYSFQSHFLFGAKSFIAQYFDFFFLVVSCFYVLQVAMCLPLML